MEKILETVNFHLLGVKSSIIHASMEVDRVKFARSLVLNGVSAPKIQNTQKHANLARVSVMLCLFPNLI